jgi:hypothetical protein
MIMWVVVGARGCGADQEEEQTSHPASDLASSLPASSASSFFGDMVAAPDSPGGPMADLPNAPQGTELRRSGLGGGGSGNPKVFYLVYADGHDIAGNGPDACAGKGAPPKFVCRFAPTLAECQRQVQAYLDRWYADLDIVFTFTRPTSGSYYTEIVSSGGGAWCDVSSRVAGVAPFQCRDIDGGVAYTFIGGNSAKETAVIIAQEQAHLVGLEHTTSSHDVMHPTICTDCDGFLDADTAVDSDRCDRATQNSSQMIAQRLGAWPGGPKPSPFGCMQDETVPYVKITSPADGAVVSSDFTVRVDARDDCQLVKVQVSVSPLGLMAESTAAPFEWDLTSISGGQTITVTAIDEVGHATSATVTVDAPPAGAGTKGEVAAAAGCTVASGTFGLSGLLPSLAMLLMFSRRHRRAAARSRRRLVRGALAETPAAPAGGAAEGADRQPRPETSSRRSAA